MSYAKGDLFETLISDGEQVRIDTDKVKTLLQSLVDNGRLTAEEKTQYFKTIPTTTVKTTRIDISLKAKWVAPSLGANTTPEFITDQLGAVRERIKDDQRTEGFLKEALKSKLDGLPGPSPEEIKSFDELGGSDEGEDGFSLYQR